MIFKTLSWINVLRIPKYRYQYVDNLLKSCASCFWVELCVEQSKAISFSLGLPDLTGIILQELFENLVNICFLKIKAIKIISYFRIEGNSRGWHLNSVFKNRINSNWKC